MLRISFVLVLLEAQRVDSSVGHYFEGRAVSYRRVSAATHQCTRTNEKSCKFRKVQETLSNCC